MKYINNSSTNNVDLSTELLLKYPDYYSTVYYGFIEEAVENTLNDWDNNKEFTLEELHKHIMKNYI